MSKITFVSQTNNKMSAFKKLIRPKNILPSALLSTTGGWLVNPSINILQKPRFYISIIISLFVMSTSMTVNDVFDYEIDKINNPSRPLISGELTRKDAIIASIIMIFFTEILGFLFLPVNLFGWLQVAILNILLYTPVLKRIFLLKNLSCSGLISMSPVFTGLAIAKFGSNTQLVFILARQIFFGSLNVELLLDICDIDGDREHKIPTIPVVFGHTRTLQLSKFLFLLNVIMTMIDIHNMFGFKLALIIPLIYAKSFYDLLLVSKYHYSKNYIKHIVSETTKTMFLFLVYLSFLAR